MCEKTSDCKTEISGLLEKFSQMEGRYIGGEDKLKSLEKELYEFKENNINDPDYSKLIAHIKNKAVIKNNSLGMNDMVATLILSVAGIILTVAELEGMKQCLSTMYMIVGLIVLVSCCFVTIPIIIERFGSKIKRNFYEICLNILE